MPRGLRDEGGRGAAALCLVADAFGLVGSSANASQTPHGDPDHGGEHEQPDEVVPEGARLDDEQPEAGEGEHNQDRLGDLHATHGTVPRRRV